MDNFNLKKYLKINLLLEEETIKGLPSKYKLVDKEVSKNEYRENSFYTVGLHVSSYLETLYGVKTFAEVETSLIFDIVEIENLSKTIARDVDTWITNVPNIYKEICAG